LSRHVTYDKHDQTCPKPKSGDTRSHHEARCCSHRKMDQLTVKKHRVQNSSKGYPRGDDDASTRCKSPMNQSRRNSPLPRRSREVDPLSSSSSEKAVIDQFQPSRQRGGQNVARSKSRDRRLARGNNGGDTRCSSEAVDNSVLQTPVPTNRANGKRRLLEIPSKVQPPLEGPSTNTPKPRSSSPRKLVDGNAAQNTDTPVVGRSRTSSPRATMRSKQSPIVANATECIAGAGDSRTTNEPTSPQPKLAKLLLNLKSIGGSSRNQVMDLDSQSAYTSASGRQKNPRTTSLRADIDTGHYSIGALLMSGTVLGPSTPTRGSSGDDTKSRGSAGRNKSTRSRSSRRLASPRRAPEQFAVPLNSASFDDKANRTGQQRISSARTRDRPIGTPLRNKDDLVDFLKVAVSAKPRIRPAGDKTEGDNVRNSRSQPGQPTVSDELGSSESAFRSALPKLSIVDLRREEASHHQATASSERSRSRSLKLTDDHQKQLALTLSSTAQHTDTVAASTGSANKVGSGTHSGSRSRTNSSSRPNLGGIDRYMKQNGADTIDQASDSLASSKSTRDRTSDEPARAIDSGDALGSHPSDQGHDPPGLARISRVDSPTKSESSSQKVALSNAGNSPAGKKPALSTTSPKARSKSVVTKAPSKVKPDASHNGRQPKTKAETSVNVDDREKASRGRLRSRSVTDSEKGTGFNNRAKGDVLEADNRRKLPAAPRREEDLFSYFTWSGVTKDVSEGSSEREVLRQEIQNSPLFAFLVATNRVPRKSRPRSR
jgi:hypothetical protein